MSDIVERDIYEVANQLGGYVGPDTPERLKRFLLKEEKAAAALADEITSLRSELANARNAALEEAAEILDDAGGILVDEWTSDLGGTDQTRAAGIASHRVADAAEAIRALKAEGESR